MNVSMPPEIRKAVKQAAISTAAHERETVDDSEWVVRAISEKLLREKDALGLTEDLPPVVRECGSRSVANVCRGVGASLGSIAG